jgi:hypothetical protein
LNKEAISMPSSAQLPEKVPGRKISGAQEIFPPRRTYRNTAGYLHPGISLIPAPRLKKVVSREERGRKTLPPPGKNVEES